MYIALPRIVSRPRYRDMSKPSKGPVVTHRAGHGQPRTLVQGEMHPSNSQKDLNRMIWKCGGWRMSAGGQSTSPVVAGGNGFDIRSRCGRWQLSLGGVQLGVLRLALLGGRVSSRRASLPIQRGALALDSARRRARDTEASRSAGLRPPMRCGPRTGQCPRGRRRDRDCVQAVSRARGCWPPTLRTAWRR